MDDDGLEISNVLPVAEGSDTLYELDLPPANGLEYLRRVRLEAKSYPSTVTVELQLPSQTQQPNSSVTQHVRSSGISSHYVPQCSPAPAGYAPSLEWQMYQVAEFSKVRMKLSKEVRAMKKAKKEPAVRLPAMENREGWCLLCFGKRHNRIKNEVDVKEEPSNVAASSSETASTDQQTESTNHRTPTLPLLGIISQMDQETVVSVLDYHIQWFEATGFTQPQGQWFYALLAALEKPLLPESCSLIRSLARICSNLRASLDSADDSLLAQLNLIICLVGHYFDQTDLCDVR